MLGADMEESLTTSPPEDLAEMRAGTLRITPAIPLSEEALTRLEEVSHRPLEVGDRVLGGRIQVFHLELPDIGPVVVKPYSRGGALRKVLQFQFVRSGKTRPENEQQMLLYLLSEGIPVPEPVAAMTRGSFLYHAWLVMRAIEPHRTLAQLACDDENLLVALMPKVCDALQRLLELRVFHVDLHPGNVLVNEKEEIFIIDFDHASYYQGPRRELRDRYLQRWRRAVIKHELPEVLSEMVCGSLRERVLDDSYDAEN